MEELAFKNEGIKNTTLDTPPEKSLPLVAPVERKFSILLIATIILSWLIYIPCAFIVLALSAMGTDSGGPIPLGIGALILAINLTPLSLMVFMTWKAITERSVLLAISSPFIAGAPVFIFLLIANMFW